MPKILSKKELKQFYLQNRDMLDSAANLIPEPAAHDISRAYGLRYLASDTDIPEGRGKNIPNNMCRRRGVPLMGLLSELSMFPDKSLERLISFDTPRDIEDKYMAGQKIDEPAAMDIKDFNRYFHETSAKLTNMLKEKMLQIDGYGPDLLNFAQKYGYVLDGLFDTYVQVFCATKNHEGIADNELRAVQNDIGVMSACLNQFTHYSENISEIIKAIDSDKDINIRSNERAANLLSYRSYFDYSMRTFREKLSRPDTDKTFESFIADSTGLVNVKVAAGGLSSLGSGILGGLEDDELLTLYAAPYDAIRFSYRENPDHSISFYVNDIDLQFGTATDLTDTSNLTRLKGLIAAYREISKPAPALSDSQKAQMASSRINGTPDACIIENSAEQIYRLEKNKIDNKREPMGPVIMEDGSIKLNHIHQDRFRSSDNGCWSVSLSLLMQSRGITLEQEQIRAYVPGSEGTSPEEYAGTEAYNLLTKDIGNSPLERSDVILRTLPNTAVRNKKIEIGRMTPEALKYAEELISDTVLKALTKDKSPVSLLIDGHVRTVVGINDGMLIFKDSAPQDDGAANPDAETVEAISSLLSRDNVSVELTWLKDIKPDNELNSGIVDPLFPNISFQKGIYVNNAEDKEINNTGLQREGYDHTFIHSGGDVPDNMIVLDDLYVPGSLQKMPENTRRIEDEVTEFHPRYDTAIASPAGPIPNNIPPKPSFLDKLINIITFGHGSKVQAWNRYNRELHEHYPNVEKTKKWLTSRTPVDTKTIMQMIEQQKDTVREAQPDVAPARGNYSLACEKCAKRNSSLTDLARAASESMNRLQEWSASDSSEIPDAAVQDLANIAVMNAYINDRDNQITGMSPDEFAASLAQARAFRQSVQSLTAEKLRETLSDNCLSFTKAALKQSLGNTVTPADTAKTIERVNSQDSPRID